MSKGFSAIALLILIAIILIASCSIYISRNYDLSFNISKKQSSSDTVNNKKSEMEEIPTTNLQDMTCGYFGFADINNGEYSIFSHPNLYKYGKEGFSEKLSLENTEKVKQALRQVMQRIPPEHNPTISICFTDSNKFILIADQKVHLLHLDTEYNLLKIILLEDFQPIYDFLAYTSDKNLYIKQSSKDYKNGKMTDAVLKLNLNDGSQKLLNYSERVETVGVPQKNNQDQSATMTSKNLGITFIAPAGVEATYNPLYDQAIEFFYFKKGEDELEVSLGKNPYCTASTPGYFREIQTINFANKWQIGKVRSDDPRDSQTRWGGAVLADDGICIGFKETINKDSEMEKVFDEIMSSAKVN